MKNRAWDSEGLGCNRGGKVVVGGVLREKIIKVKGYLWNFNSLISRNLVKIY